MSRFWLPAVALFVAVPLSAQSASTDPSLVGIRGMYENTRDFIVKSAEMMPEADYAYKPTPEVRSFGQLIGHIANAGFGICASAVSEQPAAPGDAEKLTSKAEIVNVLKASFAVCDKAYAMAGMNISEEVALFGQQHTRLSVLAFNMGHNFEHYGNMVTYMRLKGMVPPSSGGGN